MRPTLSQLRRTLGKPHATWEVLAYWNLKTIVPGKLILKVVFKGSRNPYPGICSKIHIRHGSRRLWSQCFEGWGKDCPEKEASLSLLATWQGFDQTKATMTTTITKQNKNQIREQKLIDSCLHFEKMLGFGYSLMNSQLMKLVQKPYV